MRPVIARDGVPQATPHAAGDIHHDPDVAAVHHLHQVAGGCQMGSFLTERNSMFLARRPAQVGMKVDHRELGAWQARFGHVEHALGLEILQQEVGGGRGWCRSGFRRADRGMAGEQGCGGARKHRSAVHFLSPAGR